MIFDALMFLAVTAAEATSVTAAGMMEKLSVMTIEEVMNAISAFAMLTAGKLVKLLFIWFVGRWITRRLLKVVRFLMEKRNVNLSVQTFVLSLIDVVTMIILIVMIVGVIGIDTSSFIALFASAGMAVGMALSGTLQNFAGGVMILLFRPFKVGDVIEAQGVTGSVKEIQIFNTVINTPDNKVIMLPNGPVSTGIINNYSREKVRRVDMTFSISYGDDVKKAEEVLLELLANDERVLDKPSKPFIALSSLAASSIDMTVRVWCKQEDYWGIYFDMNKKVYETFPKNGLNFPYQTLTVNVTKE